MGEHKPIGIQRKRTKGFNLQAASTNPNGVMYVGRPGPYGNPFKIGHRYEPGDSFLEAYGEYLDDGLVTPENCLVAFRAYCERHLEIVPEWLEPLRGKDLACFCPIGSPCHREILIELANR